MDAITKIVVRGFRSLRDVELEPQRITVLIGANGSGKSNLLNALRMLARSRTGNLRRFVGDAGGASALLHYGPERTREIELGLEFDSERGGGSYTARLGYAAGDQLVYLDEQVGERICEKQRVVSLGAGHFEAAIREAARSGALPAVRNANRWLASVTDFHFHDTSWTSELRRNAWADNDRYLRSNGSNLAAYLYALGHGESDSARAAWKRLSLLVRRVAPFIAELTPGPIPHASSQNAAVRLDWVDDQGETFGPHQFSDGTLRAIALITALAQPTETLPALLCIDEPELGLHPAGINVLVELIRAVAHRCQIVLATQSPALLDHFAPEEVVVAERIDGATRFRRLEPEQLAGWLEDYSLSELFDKNVLGGRP